MQKQVIKFKNRSPYPNSIFIGNEDDNLARQVQFVLPSEIDGAKIYLHLSIGEYSDVIELDDSLIYVPTRTHTQYPGNWTGYLEAHAGNDTVWHSNIFTFKVGDLPDSGEQIEQAYPSAIESALNEIRSLSQETELNAQQVSQDKQNVEQQIANTNIEFNQLKDDLSDLAPAGAAVGQLFRVAAISEDGKYTMEPVDMPSVPVQDVQVNGESIVDEFGKAMLPNCGVDKYGLIKGTWGEQSGTTFANETLYIVPATNYTISSRIAAEDYSSGRNNRHAIVPSHLDFAVKAAMCDGKGAAWTTEEQAAARERMGIPGYYELLRDITVEEDISTINLGDVQSKDAIIIIKSVSGCGNTPYYRSSSGLLFYAGNGAVIYSVARISRYYVETTARSSINEYSSCSKLLADSVDANVGNLSLYGNISANSITAGTNIKIYVR